MKILIVGTPGTGKTTISLELAKEYSLEHMDMSQIIKEKKLYKNYSKKYDTYEFSAKKVSRYMRVLLEKKNSIVIETHTPGILVDTEFSPDHTIKLECNIGVLRERLESRGYNRDKIQENIDSEAFDVVGEELEELECIKDVLYIDTSKKNIEETINEIKKVIKA